MTYTITYNGKGISLNQLCTLHWSKSKKLKDELKTNFTKLITHAQLPRIKKFRLYIEFNARYDCDNIVAMSKVFVDCLRYSSVIAEDTKDIFPGLSINYNNQLTRNEYRFSIHELDI